MFNKKGINPIIATILLIVVAVVSAVGFQNWFGNYSTNLFTKTQQSSDTLVSKSISIENLIDQTLYLENEISNNYTIKNLKIAGIDCNVSFNLTLGINEINISKCLNNLTSNNLDVVLFTDKKIEEKYFYVQNLPSISQSGATPVDFANCSVVDGVQLNHTQSALFYNTSFGSTCYSETRICTDGNLSGSYNYSNCNIVVFDINPFISTWDTTLTSGGSSNITQITLPLESSGSYNFIVYWGDGLNNMITSWNQSEVTHNYASSGIYLLNISGQINGFRFNNAGDKSKILNVTQWGILNLGNNGGYFYGSNNFNPQYASDNLNLSQTTNLNNMFRGAVLFNSNIENWDVSKVTDMSYMFADANSFNQPLNNWQTGKVTTMDNMFHHANNFNQALDNWNTSNVNNMFEMFADASNFNSNISTWDVSKVTNMDSMFYNLWYFDQPLNNWNVSNVQNMRSMFSYVPFNQDIGSWDVHNVTTMAYMFQYADKFNQSLSNWNTSSLTTTSYMFTGATSFNGNISNWNTNKITSMSYMFYNAKNFSHPLNWDTSKVTTFSNMFYGAISFNQPLNHWNTSKVTSVASMFYDAKIFNQSLSNWDTSKISSANMGSMFRSATQFNQNLTCWNVTQISSLPTNFNTSSALTQENLPVWGTSGCH